MKEKGYILSNSSVNISQHQCGLYSPANEHDACGVGMIVNLHGTNRTIDRLCPKKYWKT